MSYLLDWRFYGGKEKGTYDVPESGLGSAYDIVYFFANLLISAGLVNLAKVGCTLFTDRYYTSLALFTKLRILGFGAIGTILHNRIGTCKNLFKVDLEKRGDVACAVSSFGGLLVKNTKNN